jgi:hypothetical protein
MVFLVDDDDRLLGIVLFNWRYGQSWPCRPAHQDVGYYEFVQLSVSIARVRRWPCLGVVNGILPGFWRAMRARRAQKRTNSLERTTILKILGVEESNVVAVLIDT